MIIRTTLEDRGAITPKEIEMLERASKMPIVFDKDSPRQTEEDLKGFQPRGKSGRELAQVRAGQGIVKAIQSRYNDF